MFYVCLYGNTDVLKLLSFRNSIDVRIKLDTSRRNTTSERKYSLDDPLLFFDGDSLCGSVFVSPTDDREFQHKGIHIELCGVTELFCKRWICGEFLCVHLDLARPGILSRSCVYPFEFTKVSMPLESYNGGVIRVRYFLKVIVKKYLRVLTEEYPILVYCPAPKTNIIDEIQNWFGTFGGLIEWEIMFKKQYNLTEVVIGQVKFLNTCVKLESMALAVRKCEIIVSDSKPIGTWTRLFEYEIMDGDPVRGDWMSFRLFLGKYPLSPTYSDGKRGYAVRYYLFMYLNTSSGHRFTSYFEIMLYRRECITGEAFPSCANDRVWTLNCNSTDQKAQTSDTETWDDELCSSTDSGSAVEDGSSVPADYAANPVSEEGVDVRAVSADVLALRQLSERSREENVDNQTISDGDNWVAENLAVAGAGYAKTDVDLEFSEATVDAMENSNSSQGVPERVE